MTMHNAIIEIKNTKSFFAPLQLPIFSGGRAFLQFAFFKPYTFMNGREAARDLAFLDLGLYWEHCWTADGQVPRNSRRDWQRRLVTEIEAYVNPLYNDGVTALGGLIQVSGENTRFFVFNPLNWARTDVGDYAYAGSADIHVMDVATSQEVPSQIVTVDGQQYLRILANDVPSVGYKVYEIQAGPGTITDGGPTADQATGVLENAAYQVTVAERGAITSLIDKANGNRESAQAGRARRGSVGRA